MNTHFNVGKDGRICIVYIRKNACSALKAMIIDGLNGEGEGESDIRRMTAYAKCDDADIAKAEVRSFILRDPVERVISGWLNQVVQRVGRIYPEMFDGIESAIGKPVKETTFAEFAQEYLAEGQINGHFMSVCDHLKPITYSHVLHDKTLSEDACYAFGELRAEKFFSKHLNSTSALKSHDADNIVNVPAGRILETFQSKRSLPSKSSFMNSEAIEAVRHIYRHDIALYKDYLRERDEQPEPISLTIGAETARLG